MDKDFEKMQIRLSRNPIGNQLQNIHEGKNDFTVNKIIYYTDQSVRDVKRFARPLTISDNAESVTSNIFYCKPMLLRSFPELRVMFLSGESSKQNNPLC